MKQGTVKFSKEFVTPIGLKEWVGIEMEYDMSSECPKEVLTNARTIIEQWYKESNQQVSFDIRPSGSGLYESVPIGPPPVINVERTSEDIRIAELIRNIYACTELDGENGLWSYYKLASTNEEAKLAYEIMGKRLRKKESQDLLDATNEFYDKRRTKQSGNS